jgi:hypothetical protein
MKLLNFSMVILVYSQVSVAFIGLQNTTPPLLRNVSGKIFELQSNDDFSRLVTIELSRMLVPYGVKSVLNEAYSDQFPIALSEKKRTRTDYLISVKTIQPRFNPNDQTSTIDIFVSLTNNKTGEVISEFYEKSGYFNTNNLKAGNGFLALISYKSSAITNVFFKGKSSDLKNVVYPLDYNIKNCPDLEDAKIALDNDLYLAAESKASIGMKCEGKENQLAAIAMLSSALFAQNKKQEAINLLLKTSKSSNDSRLNAQVAEFQKFSTL